MTATAEDVALVLDYIAASQQARTSGETADFDVVRGYLHDDATCHQAAPWTEEPWRQTWSGADALVARLRQPINAGARLHTETVNAVAAGDEVLVEQISTLTTDTGQVRSAVCILFTVEDGRIRRLRLFRNDRDLPVG